MAIRTDQLLRVDSQRPPPALHGAPQQRWQPPSKRALSRLALIATSLTAVLVWFWPARAQVVEVVTGPAAEIVYATGTIEKENRIQLKVKSGGTVAQVVATDGQVVKKGQVLARLDNQKVVADWNSARLAVDIARRKGNRVSAVPSRVSSLELQNAQRDYDNTRRLVASGTMAPNALHEAELRLAAVKARSGGGRDMKQSSDDSIAQLEGVLKAAAEAKDDLEMKAPFDGIVLQNLLKVGDLVGPGEPAIGFARDSEPIAAVFVDEASVGRVQPRIGDRAGSTTHVTVLALDRRTFQGEVIEVASEADRTLRTFRVKIRLLDNPPELRSGMSVESNIVSRQHENALLVPTEAIQDDAVWVVEDRRARRKAVQVGIRDLELTEIEAGLEPGARIVVRPESQLHDGMLVWAR